MSTSLDFSDTLDDLFASPEPETPRLSATDWDESIRAAFADECLSEGIRAGLLLEAAQHARHPDVRHLLAQGLDRAARRASQGWSDIDRCLGQWGEMSACAFERAIEEAALEIRKRNCAGARERWGRAIVERARARLERFRSQAPVAA